MATTLGIDIGARSIRGALIRTSLRALSVERYVEVNIEALSASSPRAELVQVALRQLLDELGSAPDSIVAAVDGARASLRAIKLPLAAKKRIGEVLPFELDPLLPFPIDEAVLDYQEIGPRDGELAFLAAAVPEAAVGEVLALYAGAQITPRELAVGGAALDGLMTFVTPPEEGATLLIHLDTHASDICIVRGNKQCELARSLNEGAESAVARPLLFRTALNQTVMKYRAEGGPAIEKVLVMGVGADDPAVLQRISDALQVQVESVALPTVSGSETLPSPVFGRALALAGRTVRRSKRIDMRRGKYALPRGVSQLRDYALLATVCVLAVMLSYTFSVWAEYRALSEERDALSLKLSKVAELHFGESTTSPKRARELLEGGGGTRDPLPRFDAFRALGAISGAIPDAIVHDTRRLEINVDEGGQTGSFVLQGQIPDLTARDIVADALEAHECIEQLERGKTSTMPGAERKNYTVEGVLACPGAKRPTKGKKGSK
ncbi:MAG: ral secretion pathway protein [Myxococcaceae bacterium]|nr:ral secretion pathway protein [Myxococcaceae bacterium]